MEWAAQGGEKRQKFWKIRLKILPTLEGQEMGPELAREKIWNVPPRALFLSESQTSVEGQSGGREARNVLLAAILSEGPAAASRASWVGTVPEATPAKAFTPPSGALTPASNAREWRQIQTSRPTAIHRLGQALYSLDWAPRQGFQQNQNQDECENCSQLWGLIEPLPSPLFSGNFGADRYKWCWSKSQLAHLYREDADCVQVNRE